MDDKYIGYVYKITNLVNDKTYVGQHLCDKYPEIDLSYHGSGVLLQKAYRKYGREKFQEEVLEWCKTREELNRRELELTIEHKATTDQGGYVLRAGESKTSRMSTEMRQRISKLHKGKALSKEHIAKLNASHTGIPKSEEVKKKISMANKGNKPWCTGKCLPQSTKNKISEALKGREFTPEWKQKLSVKIKERNEGCHWFTDGEQDKFCRDCPKGFYRGRSRYKNS